MATPPQLSGPGGVHLLIENSLIWFSVCYGWVLPLKYEDSWKDSCVELGL